MLNRPRFNLRFPGGTALELGSVTRVMGVLNVTPDSFSDGGRFLDPDSAIRAAEALVEQGADIVDVGGESTRPGAESVDPDTESKRILGVIESIKRRCRVAVSVDTRHAAVARRALEAGADMINDVSGFGDPAMLPLLAQVDVPIVVMHTRGTPRTMQRETDYVDVIGSIVEFLQDARRQAATAGVSDDRIIVDPGIGFGKSTSGNLEVLERLAELGSVGRPVLVGASRKNFVGEVLRLPVEDRLEGSLAVAAFASAQGAHIIRAHDVAATWRAVRMIDAIRESARQQA
jgi:dihydropteroate synthase